MHVWELGGGLKLKDMLMVPITPGNMSNVAVCITIDLSEPGAALSSLQQWLSLVRTQYADLVKEYVCLFVRSFGLSFLPSFLPSLRCPYCVCFFVRSLARSSLVLTTTTSPTTGS